MSSSITPLADLALSHAGSTTGLRRTMPTEVRDALSWVAHVLDASLPLRATEDADDFAHRHLDRGGVGLITLAEHLGPLTAATAAHAFGNDMRKHPPVEVAGLYSSESPRWMLLDLDGDAQSVPSGLVAAFAAGSLTNRRCGRVDQHWLAIPRDLRPCARGRRDCRAGLPRRLASAIA